MGEESVADFNALMEGHKERAWAEVGEIDRQKQKVEQERDAATRALAETQRMLSKANADLVDADAQLQARKAALKESNARVEKVLGEREAQIVEREAALEHRAAEIEKGAQSLKQSLALRQEASDKIIESLQAYHQKVGAAVDQAVEALKAA